MKVLSWIDFVMTPLWLIIIYTGAFVVRRLRYPGDPTARYFLPGLTLKLFAGLILGVIYQYYYASGDTISYYQTARTLMVAFLNDFDEGLRLFFADFNNLDYQTQQIVTRYTSEGYRMPYWKNPSAFSVVRYVFIANLLTYNSYYASSLLISVLSFSGVWGLYRVFVRQYPELSDRLAVAVFFIPSVFFWGSGILKDPIAMGMLGLLTYAVYRMLHTPRYMLLFVAVAMAAGFVVFSIKPYILLSFIPFAAIWVGIELRNRLTKGFARFSITPVVLIVTILAGYAALNTLGQQTTRFSFDMILETAVRVKSDLIRSYYYDDGRGSSYNIGEFDGSIQSQLRLLPMAVFTTLFRPGLWEVRKNAFMFLAALESTALLIFCIGFFWRCGVMNVFVVIARVPFLLLCIGYSISFAFMVGLTSGNFGNLVRYKIPCVPYFVGGLIIIDYLIRENRRAKRKSAAAPGAG